MVDIDFNSEKSISDFPTTRYQGSKRKILHWLHENLKELEFESALDAFGGTCAVGYLFKLMGKNVVVNDILKFNQVIGRALIENDSITLSEKELDEIMDFSSMSNNGTFVQENFEDIYFTCEENVWLDKYIASVNEYFRSDENPSNLYKKDLAFYGLFQACLTKRPYNLFHRRNLYMRLNEVERNFGNKITWERPFQEQVRKFVLEANKSVFKGENECRSLNMSALELPTDFDLVYLDPPYVDINGDHDTIDYTYCYHFLEGIVNYGSWDEMIDYETKNLRFKKDLLTTEFKKRNVLNTFEKLFEKFSDSIIVVSYKQNGVPSIEDIKDLLSQYKGNIQTKSMHYKYALNKQNGNAQYNREVLIIGQ